ncbi:MAG TPA: site-specific integrase [Nitrospiria bacterium]|nr:site-specific integrase [Nitrospiria bacterium]
MARANGKDRGVLEFPKGSGKWWVRLVANGRERRYRAENKTQAKILYGKLKAEIREEIYFPEKFQKKDTTLKDQIKAYMATYHGRDLRNQTRYSRWWTKVYGEKRLDEITTADLEKLQKRLLTKEIKFAYKGKKRTKKAKAHGKDVRFKTPATVNRYFAFLRHIFNVAIRDDKATANPVTRLKFFKEPKGQLRFLTEGEEITLKENMAPEYFKFVRFALLTGLRRSEQFNLKWANVDNENKVITIPRSKSGETRHVQLSGEAVELLKGMNTWLTSPWVFPSPESPSLPMDPQYIYHKVFLPAMGTAKIEGVVWHTLRHTFASRLVMKGVDLRTVQTLLGHASIEMTQRYSHLSPSHLREAVNQLEKKEEKKPENQAGTVTKTVTKENEKTAAIA